MITRVFPKSILSSIACLVIIAFASVALFGCATDSSAGKGAAGGAVIGGIAGALLDYKNPWRGAMIGAAAGAALGALAGFAWDYASKQSKGYSQTQQDVNYKPEQGDRVKVTNYSLNPTQAGPGQPINLNTTYYVMTPQSEGDLNVNEIRYVKRYNSNNNTYEELGRDNTAITMKPGTRDGSGKITIPQDAQPGSYKLGFGVAYKDSKDEREVPVTISKAQGKLRIHFASTAEK
jgi:outer membrane lipoprotein SlyB